MKILTLVLSLISTSVYAQTSTFIFTATDPNGFMDTDTKSRLFVVDHVKKNLIKSKFVKLVNSREEAVIIIEITGTSEKEVPNSLAILANALSSPLKSHKADETQKKTYRHAILTVGTYTTELESEKLFGERTDLHSAIERWMKLNLKQLNLKK